MDVITYALSKKIAAHAVSGVQSMSISGQTLIINTKDSGVLTMTFPTPKDGVSVSNIDVNANNQIVFTMSDGTEIISGKIPTVKGDKGDPFTYDDFTQEQLDALKGADGYTPQKGIDYFDGGKGEPGYTPVKGVDYFDGIDGMSPTVTVTKEGKIATITCTDINGTTIATISDGADGQGGSGSGEENVIESISVNGTPISVDENKNVDITVPSIDGLATETYVDNKVADYTKTVDLADVATSGSYNDLADKPTIPEVYDDTALSNRVKTIEDDYAKSSDIPSLSGYATETWVNEQGFLTQHQDLSNYATKDEIPDVSGYITEEQLLAKDYADKTYVTEEIAKASTGGEIDLSSYLSKVEASETYVAKEDGKSLIANAEIERLANVDNYDDTEIDNRVKAIEDDYIKNTDLAAVAKSGSYNDLIDTPTIPSVEGLAKTEDIPTKVSELENDSNYLSSIPEEYVTETELSAKGYLTEHQDISGKVDKVEGKSLISDTEIARLASVDNYDDTDIRTELANKADATAIPSKVSELTNDSNYQTAEQVNSTVTTEIAKVVANAPEDFDTLKEMSDWIAGHENDVSAMNSAISDNKANIETLQTDVANINTSLGGKLDKTFTGTDVANKILSTDGDGNVVLKDGNEDDTMLKSVYDTDDDGIVDKADSANIATNATDATNAENLKLSDGTIVNADTINTKLSKLDTPDNLSVELANKIDKPVSATNGQVLTYNGTSNEWEAQDSKGGTTIRTSRTRRDITSDLANLTTAIAEQDLAKYGYAIGDYFIGASGYYYYLADMDTNYGGYNNYAIVNTHHCGIVVDTKSTCQWLSEGSVKNYSSSTFHAFLTNTALPNIKSDIATLFGDWESHLLKRTERDNAIGGWGTIWDCLICAMTEAQMHGSRVFGADGHQTGTGSKALELFRKYRFNEIYGDTAIWLKSLFSTSLACGAVGAGYAEFASVSESRRASGLILFH